MKYISFLFVAVVLTLAFAASANSGKRDSHISACVTNTTCGGNPYKCVTCTTCCYGNNCTTNCY